MRFAPLLLLACNPPPSEADLKGTRGSRVDAFFNDPGSRLDTVWEADAVKVMIDMVDSANATIELAVMGFSHEPLVEAFVRAHDRGVVVTMAGDAGHVTNYGYERFRERHVPMTIGNLGHIMHDKFMVVDGRFVFASTANWTDSDLLQNSNNFVQIDSPAVAEDFRAEHAQLFSGVFGHNKLELDNGRVYGVGDTEVEVWFSPNEDAMGRILEIVDAAEESVRFTIFAFTKDQLGGAYVRKHEQLVTAGKFGVSGVIDQSQLHSNGQYHEVYRLLGADIPLRMDGNNAESLPGDYQAGGGRLHSKTMVIDADGANPTVITGSFNWSASATQSNDEFLLVMRGARVAKLYEQYWEYLWENGRVFGETRLGQDGLAAGDVVIDEVHWYGATDLDPEGTDEFLELRNLTDRELRLDLWQVANTDDFVVGFPPGSVLPANGRFTIVDHLLEPYVDGAPQDDLTSFLTGDLVVNVYNDDRQARLYLKDEAMELFLKDPDNNVVDTVGDGGPAFAGGPDGNAVRSMQRLDPPGDGADPSSWTASPVSEGGANVNPDFRDTVLATPGEAP